MHLPTPPAPKTAPPAKRAPPLSPQVPPALFKLKQLEVLDLSGNFFLEVKSPLAQLQGLGRLQWLDMRAVHVEDAAKYWSPAKCASMQHISALGKALRRRNRHIKVLFDTS